MVRQTARAIAGARGCRGKLQGAGYLPGAIASIVLARADEVFGQAAKSESGPCGHATSLAHETVVRWIASVRGPIFGPVMSLGVV